ncbi:MAG: glycosyltransferase [Candidatus Competibacteraceae bacterium]
MPSKILLFHRNFQSFTGGHLKLWHYFNHVQHSPHYQAQIAFTADSLWNDANPWLPIRPHTLTVWNPETADALFLAGMDWAALTEAQRQNPPRPIINLIQGIRHRIPDTPLYPYLAHRAVRICVSEEVAEAVRATRRVNGPLFTIPNGLELTELPTASPWEAREIDLLIVGIKNPALAEELYRHLPTSELRVTLLTEIQPRPRFLDQLAKAKISVLLPLPEEGFYLPPLESFALGTLTICPDCIGNRSFCLPGITCLQPAYTVEALLQAIDQALRLPLPERLVLLDAARRMAGQHPLASERQAFLNLLHQLNAIW